MKWLGRLFSVRMIGALLLLIALFITILGYVNQHNGFSLPQPFEYFVEDFYANISTEFISIAITVLIIDQLYERSKTLKIKERLIRQMGTAGNELGRLAVEELRVHGWLDDGSLRKVSFYRARLGGALLFSADLEQTDFTRAGLQNADLRWVNLHNANLNSARLESALLIGANLSSSNLSNAVLSGAYLIDTDLQEADLQEADLTDACLWGANLYNTRVTEAQLQKALMLYEAVMPDGSIYDGKFDLRGDVALANETNAVDDFLSSPDGLPGIVLENETHTRQYLRWNWVSENFGGG